MTKATKTTTTTQRDLYAEVTNKIIGLIEQGVTPWRRTWSQYGLARNYATGHIYTGINMVLMNMTLHPIPYFMSFNQIQEKGGRIRKGAKAEMVIYFNVYYKDGQDNTLSKETAAAMHRAGQDVQVLKFIKYYNVFNVADIEGIEFEIPEIQLKANEQIEACDRIIREMPKRPKIETINANSAFYAPLADVVNMPDIRQFDSPEAFYATFFHELAHSTGHASRLAREAILNPSKFGSERYSQEELIAEMAASFLCASVQIDYDEITENSAAYLAGWLKVLKEDSRFIFKAAAEAQKAADFILGKRAEE